MKFKFEFDTEGLGKKIKETIEEAVSKVTETVEDEVKKAYEYKKRNLDFALVYHTGVKGKYLLEDGREEEFDKLLESYKELSEPEYSENKDPYAVYLEDDTITIATLARMIYLELLSVYCDFKNL